MNLPTIASRDEWLAARAALLAEEKELSRQRDRLSAARRMLPMVEVDKPYVFEGPGGPVGLRELFEGRRQLIVQHFMFDPSWEDGCPSCTAGCDEISDGLLRHLAVRDTTFACVARAPFEKVAAYKATRGWTFPFYSSFGSDFNYDFWATVDESVAPLVVNFRSREELASPENASLHWLLSMEQPFENPGVSCFLRDGDRVFHTYYMTARGTEWTGGGYAYLDLTALGRQEEWEEPKGRADVAREAMPNFAT
ncbi:MAG TPA: DUF899 domain-containing protein [Acidimicrobiales bacterium]|nr:DUF899 domain-containing protein [Acidimicrobiales bacterium]